MSYQVVQKASLIAQPFTGFYFLRQISRGSESRDVCLKLVPSNLVDPKFVDSKPSVLRRHPAC